MAAKKKCNKCGTTCGPFVKDRNECKQCRSAYRKAYHQDYYKKNHKEENY